MTEEKNTVTYNDTEYNVSDLSERGQQLVSLVRVVREEASGLNARLSILQGAEVTFSQELEKEFGSLSDEKENTELATMD